jgi:hypothetical protein
MRSRSLSPVRDDKARLRLRTRRTLDGPVVLVPFLRDAWMNRDTRYRRRRAVVTLLGILVTAVTVALSALYIWAVARSGSTPAKVFATVYGLLVVPGWIVGRRWLSRLPGRAADATIGLWGPTYFLLMPVAAGIGLAMLTALFGRDFPGERTARELTAAWRNQPRTAQHPVDPA